MKLSGQRTIAAGINEVYAALNNPDILSRAIPGCEVLEKISDTELDATVLLKVGPVKARFKGKVTLADLNPPHGYTLSGQGSGGAAGFARGEAGVTLREEGGATVLSYEATASVGGKLAQIGNRLIDSSARKLTEQFFDDFCAAVEGRGEGAEAAAGEETVPGRGLSRMPLAAWLASGIVLAIAAYLIFG
ncbi:MAG: carbon monoxide dehydrogenase subunit G [Sphingomonadales bacterium]